MNRTPLLGYCPVCGEPSVKREPKPNGHSQCRAGHSYPNESALNGVRDAVSRLVAAEGLLRTLAWNQVHGVQSPAGLVETVAEHFGTSTDDFRWSLLTEER